MERCGAPAGDSQVKKSRERSRRYPEENGEPGCALSSSGNGSRAFWYIPKTGLFHRGCPPLYQETSGEVNTELII